MDRCRRYGTAALITGVGLHAQICETWNVLALVLFVRAAFEVGMLRSDSLFDGKGKWADWVTTHLT